MDVKSYILSGILEDYALGQTSDQERREVECMMKIYPEISDALHLYENDLEKFSSIYAKRPPAHIRETVIAKIKATQQESKLSVVQSTSEKSPDSIKPVSKDDTSSSRSSWGYWAAAAAVLAFCVAGWQFAQNQNKSDKINALAEAQTKLENKSQDLENQVAQLSEGLNDVYNPAVKKVMLKSVKADDTMQMALMWNTNTGRVNLNTNNLPELPADKQYQLWVLKDGKPTDMGVLPKNERGVMVASNATMEGDTFAITIEPLGGKPSPTLDQLIVMGAVG